MNIYFSERLPTGDDPGGVTVSKHTPLPDGDFKITEYIWPDVTLWFVDNDKFSAVQMEAARSAFTHQAAPFFSTPKEIQS